ncbi:polyubiquitin-B-like [Trichomycterus rosablanca]|uniref:polyubiquitin-B-like n=1 Tax=Trichomycterus rosablanca TaxID=2290929 RepID=UPI002F35FBC5
MKLITKTLSGEEQTVDVTPSTTVRELKRIIAPLYNTSSSHLKLSSGVGHNEHMVDDQKTVSDYGLSSGATVMLLISKSPVPFQIFVKNEKGQTKTYMVTGEETVAQMMRNISQNEGVPVDQQRLICEGRQLESNMRLQDYNIEAESTIHMTLRLRGG